MCPELGAWPSAGPSSTGPCQPWSSRCPSCSGNTQWRPVVISDRRHCHQCVHCYYQLYIRCWPFAEELRWIKSDGNDASPLRGWVGPRGPDNLLHLGQNSLQVLCITGHNGQVSHTFIWGDKHKTDFITVWNERTFPVESASSSSENKVRGTLQLCCCPLWSIGVTEVNVSPRFLAWMLILLLQVGLDN